MTSTEQSDCLQTFAKTGCETAFAKLVQRHFDLVYCTALRLLAGDAHLAQDVAQSVFTDLARKARTLPPDVILGGWLYRHTCFTAAKTLRTEHRRHERERQAVEMNDSTDSAATAAAWQQLAPVLDEAMAGLNTTDRDALVLRFFERQPFKSVGASLGTSEEGARKRVDRALQRLRGFFAGRGITISAVLLAEVLNARAVSLAPAGMAAGVAASALTAASTGSGGLTLSLLKIMAITKTQIALTATGLALAAFLATQWQTANRLKAENLALAQQKAELAEHLADAAKAPPEPVHTIGNSAADSGELLRLRSQVGGLKRQLASQKELLAREQTAHAQPASDTVMDEVQARELAMAKMNFSKSWMLACILFAEDNKGMMPTNFDQAFSLVPDQAKHLTNVTTEQFELMYNGSLRSLTNPSQTILLREKVPVPAPGAKGWVRAYGFADGHSELHRSEDGNFDEWESSKIQTAP